MLSFFFTFFALISLSFGHSSDSTSSSSSSSSSSDSHSRPGKGVKASRWIYHREVPAYVAHGINNYNGEMITDYKVAGIRNGLRTFPGIYEIAVFNESGTEPELITAMTDTSKLVATTSSLNDFIRLPPIDANLVNVPINDIGALFLGGPSIKARRPIKDFADVQDRVFARPNTPTKITLADWNRASGKLTIRRARKSSMYEILFEMCGFPESLYTMWEVAENTAETDPRFLVIGGPSGLPNVIFTDEYGYGRLKWKSKWNPFEECVIGNKCTTDFSIVYHWDGAVYAGGPALAGQGMPTGIIAGNHLIVPTIGKNIRMPTTKFDGPYCLSFH